MRRAPARPCLRSPGAVTSTTGVPFGFPVCELSEMAAAPASGEQLRGNPAWCGGFPTARRPLDHSRLSAPSPRRNAFCRNTRRNPRNVLCPSLRPPSPGGVTSRSEQKFPDVNWPPPVGARRFVEAAPGSAHAWDRCCRSACQVLGRSPGSSAAVRHATATAIRAARLLGLQFPPDHPEPPCDVRPKLLRGGGRAERNGRRGSPMPVDRRSPPIPRATQRTRAAAWPWVHREISGIPPGVRHGTRSLSSVSRVLKTGWILCGDLPGATQTHIRRAPPMNHNPDHRHVTRRSPAGFTFNAGLFPMMGSSSPGAR